MDQLDPVKNPELFGTDSRAPAVLAADIFLLTVTSTIVGLRLYTRYSIVKLLGWDDLLAFLSLLCAISCGFAQCWSKHIGLIDQPEGLKRYLITFYVSILSYNVGIMIVKNAFLAQYYRVFATPKMRKIVLAAMVIITLWSLSQTLLTVFLCVPVAGFWDSEVRATATCIDQSIEFYQNAAGNILTDITIFILPLPQLKKLNLPKAQKLVLIGIFSLGFFTVAISVIRIQYLNIGVDVTYGNVDPAIWSTTELCSGIICACLPTLRPLVSKILPGFASKIRSTKGYSQSGRRKSNGTALKGHSLGTASRSRTTGTGTGTGDEEPIYNRYPDVELQPTDTDEAESIIGLREVKRNTLRHGHGHGASTPDLPYARDFGGFAHIQASGIHAKPSGNNGRKNGGITVQHEIHVSNAL